MYLDIIARYLENKTQVLANEHIFRLWRLQTHFVCASLRRKTITTKNKVSEEAESEKKEREKEKNKRKKKKMKMQKRKGKKKMQTIMMTEKKRVLEILKTKDEL